jgi:hypothetical protein
MGLLSSNRTEEYQIWKVRWLAAMMLAAMMYRPRTIWDYLTISVFVYVLAMALSRLGKCRSS